jgi:segregation and condensation protein A
MSEEHENEQTVEETPGTGAETEEGADKRWKVKLEIFEGPLDLLLHLVRKEDVDIRDIPIATIADEYLAYLDVLKELDLNVAGEFVLMASTLVYLKSRAMIPRDLLQHTQDADGEEEDPAEVFYREFEEYQRFKEAAQRLAEKRLHQDSLWPRGGPPAELEEDGEPYLEVTLFDLVEAFREIRERAETRPPSLTIERKRVSIGEMVMRLADRLKGHRSLDFHAIFQRHDGLIMDRSMLVSTFLAVLELMRLQVIRVLQRKKFEGLRVFKTVSDEELERISHEGIREESTG